MATINLGSPVRATIQLEETARGTVSGRHAVISLSLDKGETDWDPLDIIRGSAVLSSSTKGEWGGLAALQSKSGRTTTGCTGSFFCKNEVINIACAWDFTSFLFFCCNSQHL